MRNEHTPAREGVAHHTLLSESAREPRQGHGRQQPRAVFFNTATVGPRNQHSPQAWPGLRWRWPRLCDRGPAKMATGRVLAHPRRCKTGDGEEKERRWDHKKINTFSFFATCFFAICRFRPSHTSFQCYACIAAAAGHFKAGAKKVVISAPGWG